MSSRKRRPKHGSYQRYSGKSSGDRNHRRNSNWDKSRSYYVCDICGSNVPGIAGGTPLCPRCLVPMQAYNDNANTNTRRPQ
ncbi:hypothetical protein JW979_13575, partial [bacterium]|nr:hypothetical protein [candidate division CSSED10-310 bacterium]